LKKTWANILEATDAGMMGGVSNFILSSDFDEAVFIRKLSKVEPKVIAREAKSIAAYDHAGKNKQYELVLRKHYEKGNRNK
jgi:hypothetical protein